MLAAKYIKYTSVDSTRIGGFTFVVFRALSPSQPRFSARKKWLFSGALCLGTKCVRWLSMRCRQRTWYPANAAEKLAAAVEHVGTCWNTQKVDDLLRIY